MTRNDEIQKERMRIEELFREVTPEVRGSVTGLIEDAAFLGVENRRLREVLAETGTVRVHPSDPTRQRPVEAATQYLKNVAAYTVIIKALAGMLRGAGGGEDAFDKFLAEQQG